MSSEQMQLCLDHYIRKESKPPAAIRRAELLHDVEAFVCRQTTGRHTSTWGGGNVPQLVQVSGNIWYWGAYKCVLQVCFRSAKAFNYNVTEP